MQTIIDFLEQLEDAQIFYQLTKVRDGILVEIAVPGQRWEVEFMRDGRIEIEKFLSDGTIYPSTEIQELFQIFSLFRWWLCP